MAAKQQRIRNIQKNISKLTVGGMKNEEICNGIINCVFDIQ